MANSSIRNLNIDGNLVISGSTTQLDVNTVVVDDNNITTAPMYQRARMGIGYLAQEPSIFAKLTVEDNLNFAIQNKNQEKRSVKKEMIIPEKKPVIKKKTETKDKIKEKVIDIKKIIPQKKNFQRTLTK